MNFYINWFFNKLGYMPKIDMQVGKVNLDVKPPEFQIWPLRSASENVKPQPKKKPAVKKATIRKPATKKAVAKKTTKVVKKVT